MGVTSATLKSALGEGDPDKQLDAAEQIEDLKIAIANRIDRLRDFASKRCLCDVFKAGADRDRVVTANTMLEDDIARISREEEGEMMPPGEFDELVQARMLTDSRTIYHMMNLEDAVSTLRKKENKKDNMFRLLQRLWELAGEEKS